MSFSAQSAFLENFLKDQNLNNVHIVAPDIAMPVALHYVIHRNHSVKSLLVGDGPGILPSNDGSLIKNCRIKLPENYGKAKRCKNIHRRCD